MPLFSFAATSTVTVQTNYATYPGVAGTPVAISGAVSPAPGTSGYAVTLEINTTQGLLAVYSASVNSASGAYSYTMTTGYAANGWINGTYVITAVYATSPNGPTYKGSTTFQYGSTTTSTATSTNPTTTSATATTVTTTVTSTLSTTTTQTATSSITVTGPTVTNTVPTTVSTTVTGPTVTSTTTVSSATWLYVGIAGILVAVIVGAGAAVMMMRRH